MAISTIGNITYINQNMQTTSAAHANAAQRSDIIPKEFEDKLKEIAEVRPTETKNTIDKDAQNRRNDQESEQNKRDKKEEESQYEQSAQSPSALEGHLLNIKV